MRLFGSLRFYVSVGAFLLPSSSMLGLLEELIIRIVMSDEYEMRAFRVTPRSCGSSLLVDHHAVIATPLFKRPSWDPTSFEGASSMTSILPNVYSLGLQLGSWARQMPTSFDWEDVAHLPAHYAKWWWNLVQNDPIHVFIETTLIFSIVYILFARSKDWREMPKELTAKEQEELIHEWKTQPLTPPMTEEEDDDLDIVVHAMHGNKLDITVGDNPTRKTVLNFGNFDFLGWTSDASREVLRQASLEALDRYGCGSCGPRGFYGTVDVHLELEKVFADFCGTPDSILYSDGASTCSSTVAAFCKRGDLLVVDEAVYEPIRTGVTLSRATVKWFKHNDMVDLRRVMMEVQETDKRLRRPQNAQRRFLVVEGLYKDTGSIAPLDELVKLKHEFSYRLILDESFSFGTLGKTGRGALEHFGLQVMHDAEIVTIGLENSMGSVGGITVGTEEIVDHQRLSGSGYCFSAASPPFTASAAIAALAQMRSHPELLVRLRENQAYLYDQVTAMCAQLDGVLVVTSDPLSPITMLSVADIPETDNLDEVAFCREVAREALALGVAVVSTRTDPPRLRLTISAAHSGVDVDVCISAFKEAVQIVVNRFHAESSQD